MEFRDYANIRTMFEETVARRPDEPALRWYPDSSGEAELSWSRFRDHVDQVARSLMALGVGKGDKVNIISQTVGIPIGKPIAEDMDKKECISCGRSITAISPKCLYCGTKQE